MNARVSRCHDKTGNDKIRLGYALVLGFGIRIEVGLGVRVSFVVPGYDTEPCESVLQYCQYR